MTHTVLFKPSVKKDWRKIPAIFQRSIEATLTGLRNDPTPVGSRLLHGYDHVFRIRVGNYRVIYEVDVEQRIVTIMRIQDRKKAYRGL